MSQDRDFEVSFTVYEDAARLSSRSELTDLRTTVRAFMPQQAQAMIEAQYGGRVRVWSVVQK